MIFYDGVKSILSISQFVEEQKRVNALGEIVGFKKPIF